MEKTIEQILENLQKNPLKETIRSQSNQTVRTLSALSIKKARDESGYFLVSGFHMVQEAAAAGLLEAIVYDPDRHPKQGKEIQSLLSENRSQAEPLLLPCQKNVIDRLSPLKSGTDLIGLCRKMEASLRGRKKVLLLERVQDPGNVGTLIRSACSFGADCVCLCDDSADLYNPKVLQSTQGACFQIPVVSMSSKEAIELLIDEGVPVYAAALHQISVPLSSLKKPESYCLMIGNEGQGLSREAIAMADVIVHIEMQKFESLNAAIAGSIILYEFQPLPENR